MHYEQAKKEILAPYHCSLLFYDVKLFNDGDECDDYEDEDETNPKRLSRVKDKCLYIKSAICYLVSKFLCLKLAGWRRCMQRSMLAKIKP